MQKAQQRPHRSHHGLGRTDAPPTAFPTDELDDLGSAQPMQVETTGRGRDPLTEKLACDRLVDRDGSRLDFGTFQQESE